MPYTKVEAKLEVGDSTDWLVGFDVSIKKWEQLVSGETEAYHEGELCGLCFISHNQIVGCSQCPIGPCINLIERDAHEVLQYLKDEKEKYEKNIPRNTRVCTGISKGSLKQPVAQRNV